MEVNAPKPSIQADGVQAWAIRLTEVATATTTAPCPSENRLPQYRASPGLAWAL